MRRTISALAAASLLAFAPPAMAQDTAVEAVAREDFQCVVWLSILSTTMGATDQDTQTGFNVAIGYFVGHYEAITGRDIDDNWDRAAAEQAVLNLERLSETCGARMEGLGSRMQNLGAEMVEYANSQGGAK